MKATPIFEGSSSLLLFLFLPPHSISHFFNFRPYYGFHRGRNLHSKKNHIFAFTFPHHLCAWRLHFCWKCEELSSLVNFFLHINTDLSFFLLQFFNFSSFLHWFKNMTPYSSSSYFIFERVLSSQYQECREEEKLFFKPQHHFVFSPLGKSLQDKY